jgi:hypothetical protein
MVTGWQWCFQRLPNSAASSGSDVNRARRPFVQLLLIFAVGALVNFPWELAQSPLYAGMGDIRANLWHCLLSSFGDGALLLLMFAVGLIVFRRMDWFERPGARGYLVMLAGGLAIAVGIEWVAVHLAQRWEYTNQMPRVPGLDVGIVPVAQMLVLPPLVFRIVAAILKKSRNLLGMRR